MMHPGLLSEPPSPKPLYKLLQHFCMGFGECPPKKVVSVKRDLVRNSGNVVQACVQNSSTVEVTGVWEFGERRPDMFCPNVIWISSYSRGFSMEFGECGPNRFCPNL